MKNIINLFLRKDEIKQVVPVDTIVYNVANFNLWFQHKDNGAVYANEGIYLRLDKLSESHITDYLLKSNGITQFDHQRVYEFEQEIRKDWYGRFSKSKHESVYGC
jgi:hypothetical protein